jgi:hypothetical protein
MDHSYTLINTTTEVSVLHYYISSGIMGLGRIRSFYHSKFESLVRYGIIFWGPDYESIHIFKPQKRVIQSMCGAGTGTSCRQLLKDVFEALCFLKQHNSAVQKNRQVPNHNTRTNMDLHIKPCNTNLCKKV